MRTIHIDMISAYDIKISIDGEVLEDIDAFMLEIKKGEIPNYSIKKSMFQKQKPLEIVKEDASPQWRNIHQAAEALKQEDAGTAITEWRIRQLVKENKISYRQEGRNKLVDLNEIKRYFQNNVKAKKQNHAIKMKPIF